MRTRLAVACLIALATLVLLAVGPAAQGSNGDPVVLGQNNDGEGTVLTGHGATTLQIVQTDLEYDALRVIANRQDDIAIDASVANGDPNSTAVSAYAAGESNAIIARGQSQFIGGPVYFNGTSGVATIPAGANHIRVTVEPNAMTSTTHALAMLQQRRSVQVVAVHPERARDRLAIFLDRPVALPTQVSWFLFD